VASGFAAASLWSYVALKTDWTMRLWKSQPGCLTRLYVLDLYQPPLPKLTSPHFEHYVHFWRWQRAVARRMW
jgi:hypothetical protein